jgi:lipid-binding SYLF domain-containing protein
MVPNAFLRKEREAMSRRISLTAVVVLTIIAAQVCAADHPMKTLEGVTVVTEAFIARGDTFPPSLLCEAKGVAIIPHVVKAGALVDGRFGRGVVLVHQPDGSWSQPVFITLKGIGVGVEAGVEATDIVLVFKSQRSLDRIITGQGQLKLGSDASIAIGPVGKETEKVTEKRRKAEIYCYSHSKGLFAGLSLEGDRLHVDTQANEAFYHIYDGRAVDVLAIQGPSPIAAVEEVRHQLGQVCAPPPPPPLIQR